MGVCSSSPSMSPEESARRKVDKEKSKALEAQMSADHTTDQAVNKLLLLGAGESGKSTLFKQMITIYGKGYPESERKTFIPIIFNNVITSMKTLCQQSDHFSPIPTRLAPVRLQAVRRRGAQGRRGDRREAGGASEGAVDGPQHSGDVSAEGAVPAH